MLGKVNDLWRHRRILTEGNPAYIASVKLWIPPLYCTLFLAERACVLNGESGESASYEAPTHIRWSGGPADIERFNRHSSNV